MVGDMGSFPVETRMTSPPKTTTAEVDCSHAVVVGDMASGTGLMRYH